MLILQVLLILALTASTWQDMQSPCPDVLEYEEVFLELPARWYAKINLPPGGHWQFLTIALDKKAYILGNWHGDVTTKDNKVYKIDNNLWTKSEPVRFYVRFDDREPPPEVQFIQLDGMEICFDSSINQTIVDPSDRRVTNQELYTTLAEPSTEGVTATTAITTESTIVRMQIALSRLDTDEPQKVKPIQCGKVLYTCPSPLVVNGVPTEEGQWPWQVALYKLEQVDNNYICGGTLVSHRHVITAAHCTTIKGRKPFKKLRHNLFTVYLGKHNLITSVDGVQIRLVSKITVHPEYDSVSSFSRDLSILELKSPVEYTEWVQPACLWPDALVDLNHIIGTNGSVVGWGNDRSGELLLVEMPVVSQEVCLRSDGGIFYLRVTSEYTYCAGARNGQSPCNGDSGGGMVFKMNGSWYLRGVVSIAPTKPNDNVCDPMLYVVFTDLAKFLPWIRENIEPY